MQTDSIARAHPSQPSRTARLRAASCAALLLLGLACTKPQAVVVDDLLQPLAAPQPWLPDTADLAAARLARAALIARPPANPDQDADPPAAPSVEQALDWLLEQDFTEDQRDLAALAIDVRNATLDDPIAYRAGSRELNKRRGLDPRLEGRLKRTIGDDPLKLAGRRQFDGWHRLWARSFNAVAQPLGSSAITGFVIAPFSLANSLIHYFAEFSNSEPLSFTDRQALALREEFLAKHPNTKATPVLEKKIERDEVLLAKTMALRRMRSAENALERGFPDLAVHHADAAVRILAEHPVDKQRITRKNAVQLAARARVARSEGDRLAARSLEALATPNALLESELRLAKTLLAGPARAESLAAPLAEYRAAAGSQAKGRVDFIRALTQREADLEAASRKQLAAVAGEAPDGDPMARHARAILDDDWQNPFGAFERLHRTGVREELGWRLAGEWVNRPRYPNLPAPLAYLIDTPTIAITIILAPLRAIISPWTGSPDFQRGTALAGYRYLRRYPNGEEQRPVIEWLFDYESDQERWGRALRMADWITDFDPEKRSELVEKTAEDRLTRAERLERRDSRASILRGIAQEFPDSKGGHAAGLQAREQRIDASPQHIRITKEFLLENPSVAGRSGLGLNPVLLNDDPADGEIHPDGVVLLGARVLEIHLVADGKDDKAPPESRVQKISRERLSRVAAMLDEAVQLNSLIDADARQTPDANRDVYLERATLGLTEEPDIRATAQSQYVYRSLRERYGMVRGRDSILPFDLVFRGSLGDFSLGAFPRWRAPRETADAFLYR